ncbi:Beta-galactosidase 7 [Ancistrocladus abbreviatus]
MKQMGERECNPCSDVQSLDSTQTIDVSYDGRAIKIDGRRRILISGAIHYPRSTPEMWPDLIRKAKEGGCNTIETYVFWDLHEPQPRQYDFTGNRDLMAFLKTIQALGMYAVLRIGPYVCAEWNYGGFPVWLHSIPNIQLRTDNEIFKKEMEIFVTKIVNMAKHEKLFAPQGGPIILAQIENEYGNIMWSYKDAGKRYIEWCAKMADSQHIGVPWFMSQQSNPPAPMINTCNGFYCDQFWPSSKTMPKMWTENWSGWFKNWGGRNPHRTAEDLAFAVGRFFQYSGTFVNYYMYHGGTNFGRTSGGPYIATTYDYNAPIDEYGNLNQPKWGHLKELHEIIYRLERILTHGDIQNIDYGQMMSVNVQTALMEKRKNPAEHEPYNFKWQWKGEELSHWNARLNLKKTIRSHQLLEQKAVTNDTSDYLYLMTRVRVYKKDPFSGDRTKIRVQTNGHILHVYVDEKYIGTHFGYKFVFEEKVKMPTGIHTITLISATVGLQNYGGNFDTVPVGVLGPVQLIGKQNNNEVIKDLSNSAWLYKVGLNGEEKQLSIGGNYANSRWHTDNLPVGHRFTWYKTTFKAPLGRDPVVLDLLGMGKGMAWVNGQSLGRYWPTYLAGDGCDDTCDYRGPYNGNKCSKPTETNDVRYHVPRSFFRDGMNTLVLFEEFGGNPSFVNFKIVTIGRICANAHEGSTLKLSCQGGNRIMRIDFANYGSTGGSCGSFESRSCSSKRAHAIVQQACLGRTHCSIEVSKNNFGDLQCTPDGPVTLAVEAASDFIPSTSGHCFCMKALHISVPEHLEAVNDLKSRWVSQAASKRNGLNPNHGPSLGVQQISNGQ